MTSPFSRALLLVLISLTTISCDRLTKRVALDELPGASRSYMDGTIRLEYAENTGGFLSVANWSTRTRTAVFTIGAGAALVYFAFIAITGNGALPVLVDLSLFVAGGISNVYDRIQAGHAVDFIVVSVGAVHTGIFNVADVAIMAGAALFAAGSLVIRRRLTDA